MNVIHAGTNAINIVDVKDAFFYVAKKCFNNYYFLDDETLCPICRF
jgi:hypothetical protein